MSKMNKQILKGMMASHHLATPVSLYKKLILIYISVHSHAYAKPQSPAPEVFQISLN